jgi:hypothetical protein
LLLGLVDVAGMRFGRFARHLALTNSRKLDIGSAARAA